MSTDHFGSRLREARLKKGMSQAALGDILGVTQSAVSFYERGMGYPETAWKEANDFINKVLDPVPAGVVSVAMDPEISEPEEDNSPAGILRRLADDVETLASQLTTEKQMRLEIEVQLRATQDELENAKTTIEMTKASWEDEVKELRELRLLRGRTASDLIDLVVSLLADHHANNDPETTEGEEVAKEARPFSQQK